MGLPGVGKSTIGRALAERLGRIFVDCDHEVERALGMTIAQCFADIGEGGFRDAEEAAIRQLLQRQNIVLATGGGAVVRAANRMLLRNVTACIYLQAKPEQLAHRVRRNAVRPLLAGVDPLDRLRSLHVERDPWYRETAHWSIVTTGRRRDAVVRSIESYLRGAS